MIFIIALAAALTFTIAFSALLRKHPVPFYAAAVMISILIVYCTWQHAAFPGVVRNMGMACFCKRRISRSNVRPGHVHGSPSERVRSDENVHACPGEFIDHCLHSDPWA